MTGRHLWIVTTVVVAGLLSASPGRAAEPDADVKANAAGNNAFALDLYKQLAAKETGSVLVSPYSVRTALAMTYAGARGDTAAEMRKVLHFDLPDARLHAAVAGSARAMAPTGPNPAYKLHVANGLWGRAGVRFVPEFLALTDRVCGGGFRKLDFGRDPAAARRVINDWVAGKTEQRIPELLNKDDIDGNTVLVLTNAVYFKGDWERPFAVKDTREADFEPTPGKPVRVSLMQVSGEIRYHAGPDMRAVELPYRGGRLSMVVLLPAKRHGLADLERSLTAESLGAVVAAMVSRQGEVLLPRFKSNSRFALNEPLKALGMPTAFSAGADFTGIVRPSVKIQAVIHAAEISVDEVGTEAAAATAAIMGYGSAREHSLFRADAPFLYLIRDRTTGEVIFVGRHAGAVGK